MGKLGGQVEWGAKTLSPLGGERREEGDNPRV